MIYTAFFSIAQQPTKPALLISATGCCSFAGYPCKASLVLPFLLVPTQVPCVGITWQLQDLPLSSFIQNELCLSLQSTLFLSRRNCCLIIYLPPLQTYCLTTLLPLLTSTSPHWENTPTTACHAGGNFLLI